MFRLIGFLVMFAITAGGYMFFDYKMASRWAGKEDAQGLTFAEYLSGLSGRLANLGGAASAAGLPSKLADMLPSPPPGWTTRPVEAKDVDGFLPKGGKKVDQTGVAAIKALAEGEKGSGVEVVAMTYEKGDRKLIVKAVRYPNLIFTSMAAMEQRFQLQSMTAQFRGTEFATVRGLDVTEDLLPDGFRGRMFFADVGGQIHLRILAPKRMKDEELLPFLETLHVKAMNADLIDKVAGLGDVPVIVLASALDGEARDAYLAAVASRASETTARQAAAEADAAAATAAEPAAEKAAEKAAGGGFLSKLFGTADAAKPEDAAPAAPEKSISCKTGKDGVKRCQVESAAPASN